MQGTVKLSTIKPPNKIQNAGRVNCESISPKFFILLIFRMTPDQFEVSWP